MNTIVQHAPLNVYIFSDIDLIIKDTDNGLTSMESRTQALLCGYIGKLN